MVRATERVNTFLGILVQVGSVMVVGLVYFLLFWTVWWFKEQGHGYIGEVVFKHFPAVVGLPMAALAALGLVLFLKQKHGDLDVTLPGVKFSGASGSLTLWVIAYAVIVSSIKLVW